MEAGGGYKAARETAAVFDRSWRGKIAVAGGDRRTYLQAMLTNDVLALAPGSGCYAAYLTPQGRMIADMSVLELGDLVLLDLDPATTAAVLESLDKSIFSEDVKLGDLSEAFGKLTVVGPQSARVVACVISGQDQPGPGEGDLATWTEFRNVRASFRGQMALVSASWDTGEAGFDVYVERPQVPELAAALAAAAPFLQAARTGRSCASRRAGRRSASTWTATRWRSRPASRTGPSASPRGAIPGTRSSPVSCTAARAVSRAGLSG